MKRFAVMGAPVAHSLSPQLHSYWATRRGIALSYLRVRVQQVDRILPLADLLELDGFNLTTPWKEAILPYLTRLDGRSKRLGAVNTVLRTHQGWAGYNTDPEGVSGTLSARDVLPKESETALVVGAGGAAAAAGQALQETGFRVKLINRSSERGRQLSARLGFCWHPWGELKTVCASVRLAVVAAPVDDAISLRAWFPADALILEADYRRGRLSHEEGGKSRCVVVGGEEWLVHQAAGAFHLFTGIRPDATERKTALESIRKSAGGYGCGHLLLMGLPGSGKSTVASVLASLCGRQYRDLDEIIVGHSGYSVCDLFGRYGEPRFRQLEALALRRLLKEEPAVVALGGGVVENPDNRLVLSGQTGVIWLAVPPSLALRRATAQGGRPLLAVPEAERVMADLNGKRGVHYAGMAQLVVDGTLPADRVAEGLYEEMV